MEQFSIKKLWKTSRPRFWIYLFGPFLVGSIAGATTINDLLQSSTLVFALYFLFCANLLIYGVNDIFDWETDKQNDKKISYEERIAPREQKTLLHWILIFNVPILAALPFVPTSVLLALSGFFFFGIFYSVPPIRAKARPFLDSTFNILYIFPGLVGYFLLAPPSAQPSWTLVVAAGLWAMAMHAYSAIPDIDADKKAHLATVATTLGYKGTLFFCGMLYAASGMLVIPTHPVAGFALGGIYSGLMIMSTQVSANQLFDIYKRFPVINTLAGAWLFFLAASKFF